jgi:hypothetical protein
MPAFTVTILADRSFVGAVLRESCGDDLPIILESVAVRFGS